MQLEIRSPEQVFFNGEAESVKVPGAGGTFEILNRHAAITSLLKTGSIEIRSAQGIQTFHIDSGLVEMSHNKIIILVESVVDNRV